MLLWILLTQTRSPTLPLPQNPFLSHSIPVPNIGSDIPISESFEILHNVTQQDKAAAAPVQQPTAKVDVPVPVNLTAQPVPDAALVTENSQSKPNSRKPKKLDVKRGARVRAVR